MLKGSTTEIQYSGIDYELRDLIRYMNDVDGVETIASCCGHGEMPCQIWFKADDIVCVTKFINRYFYCNPNWRVVFAMSDTDIDDEQWDRPTYLLETTFTDYYYTGMAIDNLTYKFKEIVNEV